MTVTAESVSESLGIARTSKSPRVPVLPESVLVQLRRAHARRHDDGFDPLYMLVASLRARGWSLASIAKPLGVTRESVRLWGRHAVERGLPVIGMPDPPQTGGTQESHERDQALLARIAQRSREQKVLDDLLPQLRALRADAESLRGPSSTTPGKARASAEYTALMDEALRRGVRPTALARELGIKVVTIYARLRRGGYRPEAPSEAGNRPGWADGPLVKVS